LKKVIVPTLAAIVFAGASVAYADVATDKIKSIDKASDTITLANGSTYVAPTAAKLSAFKVGEKVIVDYMMSNGKMEVAGVRREPRVRKARGPPRRRPSWR
jgi:Cu/Ag efflux protein CusF